jgi:hypothetical protein
MEFEETPIGYIMDRSEDAPLMVFVDGNEEEITRACVAAMRCWSCHENFPAPLGMVHWPEWVAVGWGNPSDRLYEHRKALIQNDSCPICSAPSAPRVVLEEIAAGNAHVADVGPDGGGEEEMEKARQRARDGMKRKRARKT